MFLRFNQILFGAFLYAAQSAILISVLAILSSVLMSLLIPKTITNVSAESMASMIMVVVGTVLMVTFIANLLSFTLFMLFRLMKKNGNEKLEAWLVPTAAALMVNGVLLIETYKSLIWEPMLFLFALSVGAVLLSRATYQRVWARLIVLQTGSGSSV